MPIYNVLLDFLPLFVSGTTASISLEKVGELKSNQTVLVTGNSPIIPIIWIYIS
jgi:NADPH-dependent curcumin reductase CurA